MKTMKSILVLFLMSFAFKAYAQADTTAVLNFDKEAQFPGGQEAMRDFLMTNIQYPAKALKKKNQGTVYLRFVISEHGTVSNVKVQRGIENCPECDAEALRVVKMMPKWTPAELNGKPINVWYNLPIKFKTN